jgi:hypothetical protein
MDTLTEIDTDHIKDEVKKILYSHAKKGKMCDDISHGQILEMRTGTGLEFDRATLGIAQWYCDNLLGIMGKLKRRLDNK